MAPRPPCPMPPGHPTGEAKHYNKGCRCPESAEARNAYQRKMRRLAGYGVRPKDGYVDASAVRVKIQGLVEAGYLQHEIAREMGISVQNMRRMLHGGQAQVRRSTAAKIMSYHPSWAATVRFRRVHPIGSARRLQALTTLGWDMAAVARRAGVRSNYLNRIRRGHAQSVLTDVAEKITAVYDELWDQAPPTLTREQLGMVTISRNIAAANGWLPPMAWDDGALEDPTAVGDPEAVRPDQEDPRAKLANLIELLDDGMTLHRAAERAGYNHRDSAARALQRAGRSTLDWAQNRTIHNPAEHFAA